jgi:hypothetical protein
MQYNYYAKSDTTNIDSSIDVAILTAINASRDNVHKNSILLQSQDLNNPSSLSYVYDPNYNITNTISTVVWSILATSIIYYVFIKL